MKYKFTIHANGKAADLEKVLTDLSAFLGAECIAERTLTITTEHEQMAKLITALLDTIAEPHPPAAANNEQQPAPTGKTCEICGNPVRGTSKTCSEECKKERARRYARAYAKKRDEATGDRPFPEPPSEPSEES